MKFEAISRQERGTSSGFQKFKLPNRTVRTTGLPNNPISNGDFRADRCEFQVSALLRCSSLDGKSALSESLSPLGVLCDFIGRTFTIQTLIDLIHNSGSPLSRVPTQDPRPDPQPEPRPVCRHASQPSS